MQLPRVSLWPRSGAQRSSLHDGTVNTTHSGRVGGGDLAAQRYCCLETTALRGHLREPYPNSSLDTLGTVGAPLVMLVYLYFFFASGDREKGHFKRPVIAGGFFIPVMKPQMGGLSSPDPSKQENEWDAKGAEGGTEEDGENDSPQPTQARSLPEQLKVFRAIEDPENDQTSPKMCRMFYTSNDEAAKSGFHGTLFPLEASPRHQRKALNISEPFAVSVPLRVSAVISLNSTPCRVPAKDKSAFSSLQESSFLGLDNAISASLEGETHTKPEHPMGKEDKKPESKAVVGKFRKVTVICSKHNMEKSAPVKYHIRIVLPNLIKNWKRGTSQGTLGGTVKVVLGGGILNVGDGKELERMKTTSKRRVKKSSPATAPVDY